MYNQCMRKQYEQICMDNLTIDGEDPLDLVGLLPKIQFKVWKHLFNGKDLDNQVATTMGEISEEMGIHYPNVGSAIRALVVKEHLQRDGIHFYINPYHWWFGDDTRKQHARASWDNRKEIENAE